MPDSGRAAYTKAHNENLGKLIPHSLHLDIPALPPIPLSLSDDWFSHETLSHNGINLPRFSLCAFV